MNESLNDPRAQRTHPAWRTRITMRSKFWCFNPGKAHKSSR
jgi:hypothetical protein